MPGEAWIGLNDINVENHFVYTDGTPAVSSNIKINTNQFDKEIHFSFLHYMCWKSCNENVWKLYSIFHCAQFY